MNLATETMKGMRENAERGYHNGGHVPSGDRLQKVTDGHGREHPKLAFGPDDEVATVREIFRLAVEENRGAREISRILNERGVPGPCNPSWSPSTVGHVLEPDLRRRQRLERARPQGAEPQARGGVDRRREHP